MVFICGPVVVSPSAKIIHFQTILPSNIKNVAAEWLKTKNDITRVLKDTEKGISMLSKNSIFETLEIQQTGEIEGEYQLSLTSSQFSSKSNKINLFVDGEYCMMMTLKHFICSQLE